MSAPDVSIAKANIDEVEKDSDSHSEKPVSSGNGSEIDLLLYHEHNAGRLVVDPEEARIEFGDAVAKKLKLSSDGTKVLWPQPTDDPDDPQNVRVIVNLYECPIELTICCGT